MDDGFRIKINSPKESEMTIHDATVSGFKNAAIAGVVASGPVLAGCRAFPWAKANLNYTAQALLISSASIAAFFITADKTILENAKQNSRAKFNKSVSERP
ncbi:hypothetical protein ZOSMA_14G00840 [Zostera marina]|uniref:Early nodulin-93 n=1 Tax=Zostera marina TaxID=29655 RepID=A0A0K9PYL1_ZOSMR|nr:hypothetical protein ZOSMA_14G00840 [Zostera marina]